MDFKMTSPAFNNGTQIPSKYTCDGEDINPHLVIHGVPERAKSLALIMENLDAPAGQEVHWLVWNIPAETSEIREHTLPFHALAGVNSHKKSGYSGPCPKASSPQRFVFRLFALDKRLELAAAAKREELEAAMEQHIMATAELQGSYARTNEAPL